MLLLSQHGGKHLVTKRKDRQQREPSNCEAQQIPTSLYGFFLLVLIQLGGRMRCFLYVTCSSGFCGCQDLGSFGLTRFEGLCLHEWLPFDPSLSKTHAWWTASLCYLLSGANSFMPGDRMMEKTLKAWSQEPRGRQPDPSRRVWGLGCTGV